MDLRKYGEAATIEFPLFVAGTRNFAGSGDYTYAAGDITISKDGGAAANVTNSPTAVTMGNAAMWQLTLTATEMQAAKVKIVVSDAATKAVDDQAILIHTYGNASALHAFDLDTATQSVDVIQINGDSVAAVNAELFFDGTGYNAANSTLGTVTTVTNQVTANVTNWNGGALTADTAPATRLDAYDLATLIERIRPGHTHVAKLGSIFYVAPNTGRTVGAGATGRADDPVSTIQDVIDNLVSDSVHDLIMCMPDATGGATTLVENVTLNKRFTFLVSAGRDFILRGATSADTITVTADGCAVEKMQIDTFATGSPKGIQVTGVDFFQCQHVWFNATKGDAINILASSNCRVWDNNFQNSGSSGTGNGIVIRAGNGQTADNNQVKRNIINSVQGDAIRLNSTGGGSLDETLIIDNRIFNATGFGINIVDSGALRTVIDGNAFGGNADDYDNNGTDTNYLTNDTKYENGSIWIDSTSGDDGNPGTARRPVLTMARAVTLSDTFGFGRIQVASGSSLTLGSATEGQQLVGAKFAVALNGQSISNSEFFEAVPMTGTATVANGSGYIIRDSLITTASLSAEGFIENSALGATLTLTSTAGVTADNLGIFTCKSFVAGSGTPTIDASGATKAMNVSIRAFDGGLGFTGNSFVTSSIEIRKGGTLTVTSGGGDFELRGDPKAVVLASSGSGTVNIVLDNFAPITITGAAGTVNILGKAGYIDVSGFTGGAVTVEAAYVGISASGGATLTLTSGKHQDLTEVSDILLDTGTDGVALSTTAKTEINAEVVDVLRTDLIPDSYATDGNQPTIAQALLAIHQFLMERSVSGTTMTVNKPDGTTAAMTFTLDDASAPTSITRST